jgi:hypothetical protein
MNAHGARLGVLVAVVSLAVCAPAQAESVTEWNLNAANALLAPAPPNGSGAGQGAFSTPNLAMVHLAVFDAVNAIDHRYKPYLGTPPAKPWYSQDAAVAAAAHRVLVSGHVVLPAPSPQQATLEGLIEPLYEKALKAIPDGDAKTGGIATGEAAAWAIIAARTGDGRFGTPGFPLMPPGPGVWEPITPGANDFGAWLRDVEPFALRHPERFFSRGPNPLTSPRYADEFNEVKAIGKSDSATRSLEQTAAAEYWGRTNAVATWAGLIRSVAGGPPMSTVDRARFYALVYLTAADTLIVTWKDKALRNFWRPITAIQRADTDGNPATEPDPDWTPLINNPPYPEHPSGLSAFGGSNVATMQELLGTDQVMFGYTNPTATRTYTRLSQAIEEIVDARVWSGIHFRAADVQGARIGRKVAGWRREHRLLRPLRHHR